MIYMLMNQINIVSMFKGIIRAFKLKEIDLFYYFIDAGEFSYSNDIHETTISGLFWK